MRMNVYEFLNYMNKKYDEFKKQGDTYLKYDKLFFNSHINNHVAEDLGLKKDFEGLIIIFYGNNSDKELSFLLRTKNSKIVSIDIVPTKKIKKNINSKK